MQLREMMTKPVEMITPQASLVDAARKMLIQDVGSLPVCEDEKLVGIITDRDITIRAIANGLDPAKTEVQEVMSHDVVYCGDNSDVEDACRLMQEQQVRRLVVTDEKSSPIGIVSIGDMALQMREEQAGEILRDVSQP